MCKFFYSALRFTIGKRSAQASGIEARRGETSAFDDSIRSTKARPAGGCSYLVFVFEVGLKSELKFEEKSTYRCGYD